MPRYAAFLRGVMPTNASSAGLRRAYESAGFGDVRTVRASGNVVFTAATLGEDRIIRRAEKAVRQALGRGFLTFVRPIDELKRLLASDPYAPFGVPANAKRLVTFLLQRPAKRLPLPVVQDGARILAIRNREAFSAYEPGTRGPVFMALIERTLGSAQTTRTWETVQKVVEAGST